ncbi:AraC family transcriptional regulator [Aquabacter spiritensis]|uniref:AraC-like DNA-binding protein n=1 Tax=Aquabacter spiritensis TaxID=933073 RepID=A0A4R3LMR2_9HYPH|nr:AraC family transcriptional regulator [Aquabacter spiritensis]TCT01680.1 AraC-like DNA-binding protein [Aquabacter spiritensis]
MPNKTTLPPLAFVAPAPWEEVDAEAMSERLNTFGTARVEYRPRRTADPFRSLSAGLQVGRLRLSANSCSAVRYRVSSVAESFFIIPMDGEGETIQERRSVRWRAGEGGAFISRADAVGFSTRRSVLGVIIDEAEIAALARHMLNGDHRPPDLRVSQPLAFGRGGFRFDVLFRRLLAAIDGCVQEPTVLARSGLDDAFHRAIVMWMQPEAFLAAAERMPRRPRVDDVCDYILANLDKKLTLTMLESVGGLSPRVLQYAFREKFGCSPMQWVRDRRLEAVRTHILNESAEVSISTIASQYFSNLGEFSQKYKAHFGELPSETRRRRAVS